MLPRKNQVAITYRPILSYRQLHIELSQDAELSIRIYDDEYEGDFDGREYDE